jgi:tRNA pseudouridine38-40 synthase
MARNIVGTLVHVGRKIILPTAIPMIIAKRSRPSAGMTAPAHGLTLTKVDYSQEYLVYGTMSDNLYPLTE